MQFKKDLEVRQAAEAKRVASATSKHVIVACLLWGFLVMEHAVLLELKNEGNAAFRLAKFEDAEKFYKKALKVTPLEVSLLTNLAQVRAAPSILAWLIYIFDLHVLGCYASGLY